MAPCSSGTSTHSCFSELLAQRNFTQITTDQLDEPTLEKVRGLLASADREVVEVSAPRDKLESLFLRIVQEARERHLSTSGVTDTGRMAEFLRPESEPQGRQVIEELVSAAPEPKAPAAPPEVPLPPEPAADVLESLVRPEAPAPRAAAPQTAPAPRPAVEADRVVIDDLLGPDADAPDEQDGPDRSKEPG